MQGFAEEGDLQGVLQLMKEMKSSPVCAVDRVAYSAMVDACIQAGSAEGTASTSIFDSQIRISTSHSLPASHGLFPLMLVRRCTGQQKVTGASLSNLGRYAHSHGMQNMFRGEPMLSRNPPSYQMG